MFEPEDTSLSILRPPKMGFAAWAMSRSRRMSPTRKATV